MAKRTIARMYDSYADASAAVGDLEAARFSHDEVSLIANRQGDADRGSTARRADDGVADTDAADGAVTGAAVGAAVGGTAGLLAGIGALAIPGFGPLVAAGWLAATLASAGVGAAAGGLLGALTEAGLGDDEANLYAEGVRRGGNLVVVRADESRAAEVERILDRHNPVDKDKRASEYRDAGWTPPR
jgi:hypothetical protein